MAAFASEEKFCSLALSKGHRFFQHVYKCESCGILLCEGCLSCHENCATECEYLEMEEAICECGAGTGGKECLCVDKSIKWMDTFGVSDEESTLNFIRAYNMARDYDCPGPLGDQSMRLHSIDYQSVETIAKDCHILTSLSKETFYIDSHTSPRCRLEAVAQQILLYHISQLESQSQCGTIGAEFWCQVKDSISENNIASGVDIHYDKDEFLSDKMEIGVFPAISTVTYLSAPAGSAATIILGNKIDDRVGEGIQGCLLSYPQVHKHVSFDGRFLHGAPAALNKPVFLYGDSNKEIAREEANEGQGEEVRAREKRVTFLVNVWIDHRPIEAATLSESQVAALNEGGGWEADTALVFLSPLDLGEGCTLLSVTEAQCPPSASLLEAADKGGKICDGDNDDGGGANNGDVVMIRIPFLGSDEEVAWGFEKKETGGSNQDQNFSVSPEEEVSLIEQTDNEDEEEEEEDLSVFIWLPVAEIASRLSSSEDARRVRRIADSTFMFAYESDQVAPRLA